jgi:membrane-bound inhibitor of C-type lysozyme
MHSNSPPARLARTRRFAWTLFSLGLALATLAGCGAAARKDAEEAAKDTFTCQLGNERLLIKFDSGEARMLMGSGDRVTLYQIAAASGVRFTNGMMELRGKGTELELVRDGVITPLADCKPYVVPK